MIRIGVAEKNNRFFDTDRFCHLQSEFRDWRSAQICARECGNLPLHFCRSNDEAANFFLATHRPTVISSKNMKHGLPAAGSYVSPSGRRVGDYGTTVVGAVASVADDLSTVVRARGRLAGGLWGVAEASATLAGGPKVRRFGVCHVGRRLGAGRFGACHTGRRVHGGRFGACQQGKRFIFKDSPSYEAAAMGCD